MHDLSPKVKKDHAWNVCFFHILRHALTYGWKLKKEKKNPDVAGSLKTKKTTYATCNTAINVNVQLFSLQSKYRN